uniref:Fungal lipase-like domain-containing protein n=1 Tax=Panagrolaimus sp. JU765 TaxID=591449 RepID=A0AC34QPU1_9BILA
MLWNAGMKNDFLALKNANPDYQVWVTGHSLGGAMASVAASSIVHLGYSTASNLKLYTFGQPRTGDKTFAAAHDKLIPESYRVTHKADMVPHVPPENLLSYFHHQSEVWYNNDMTPGSSHVECNADESKKCSDGLLIKLSIQDHLKYFDTDVSGYGVAGCR